jgi:hypothetical protein
MARAFSDSSNIKITDNDFVVLLKHPIPDEQRPVDEKAKQ